MQYFKSLFITHKPADLEAYASTLCATLKPAGRMEAVQQMVWASKADCEARIPRVTCPVVVLMGSKDPDFPVPADEGAHVAKVLRGRLQMVDGAGHYPHAEQPDVVATAVLRAVADGRGTAAGAGALA